MSGNNRDNPSGKTINTPKGKMKIKQANNGLVPTSTGGVQLQSRLNADDWPAWQNHGKNFRQPEINKDPAAELKKIREKVKLMQTELAGLMERMDLLESEIND